MQTTIQVLFNDKPIELSKEEIRMIERNMGGSLSLYDLMTTVAKASLTWDKNEAEVIKFANELETTLKDIEGTTTK